MLDPESHHPHQFLEQSALIGSVEVDRIDVLVFLGRILGVLDTAVRAVMEPIRMLADPRMVGRALDCKIERHLDSETVGRRVEAIEVAQRPDRRIYRGVSARLAANRPPTAGRVRTTVEPILRTLPIRVA